MHNELSVAIAIATTGRADMLTDALEEIARQTRKPDLVAICPAFPRDVDHAAIAALDLDVSFSTSPPGACAQRNALLAAMPAVDLVLFLDDDFFIAPDFIAELVRLFASDPTIMLATGVPIADGANGPGFTAEQARRLIADHHAPGTGQVTEIFGGYGCNMAVRWSAVAAHGLRFDENLPLYSWAEDIEFSRQVARFGRVVKSNRLRGVHLATKRGRTSDLRFGYSQVANQVYLKRKGVISTKLAILHAGRNVLANMRGLFLPETYIDRRGRLLGNIYSLVDLARGRCTPARILDL